MYRPPSEPASLASLPTEIADTIYKTLTPATLACLARVSKEIYAAVQGPLYRRPVLNSYRKLQQFVQTLNKVASWDIRGDASSKKIVHLTLLIDPAREQLTTGKPLIAVLLARLVGVIARYNPDVSITLIISHSACNSQPVRSFESEQFPRITSLILDLGNEGLTTENSSSSSGSSSLDTVIPVRRHMGGRGYNNTTSGRRCQPNYQFWTRFFNGRNFPDLQRLELHHRSPRGPTYGAYDGWEGLPILFTESDTSGLAKIHRLVVNSVPEFNDAVLMAGLQHAPLLTDLQIEDCYVTYSALDKLLLHALPVLNRLVLRIPSTSRFARQVRQNLNVRNLPEENPHLCPHFRRSGKNLKYFELTAPFICRDIFLDEHEKLKLRESGHPGTLAGDESGAIVQGALDVMLVTGVLKRLRQHRETDSEVQKTAVEADSLEEDRKLLEKERLLRNRRFTIAKERWTRKIHVLDGMCCDGDTFDELVALAEVEEQGVTWNLGHQAGETASKVIDGMVHDLDYQDEFQGNGRRELSRSRTMEHDVNDDLVGQ
ncbi:hypothetical protein H072_1748 [Dactylellina haptotyla CBS 200.50]|uniref:F-box domain-containing protein n=1 Tax=Dactylellina haptotyla (strain CBS 200.50) TaxID=1284197 RepID=S8C975_DACHA|nr:hypothetical protein H072_1748 [Dactylellina haptotyla CBS 200.50]